MNKYTLYYLKVLLLISFFSVIKVSIANEKLLVFGDSLSASYGINLEDGWSNLLSKMLKEKNISLDVVNKSISGETTSGGIRRLPKLLLSINPKIIIIELGANDGLRGLPLAQTKKNLNSMIKLSKKYKVKPLLVGIKIPPNYGKSYSRKFYDLFGQAAIENNIPFVPFMFEGFATKKDFFLRDQIHPNEKAQVKILENIWFKLKTLI